MAIRRSTRIVQITSLAMLTGVVAVWLVGARDNPRADLQGPPVTIRTVGPFVPVDTTTPIEPTSLNTATPASPLPGRPVRLSIPSLSVDSPVDAVGLDRQGAMDVPGATQAGWYRDGPLPGSRAGSAVVAAHVDFNGVRGVFYDLRSLQVGSSVELSDDRGVVRRFVVSERFQVAKHQLPMPEMFRHDGPPVLTLITCGGDFDPKQRHYADNIVVRATESPSS